jgi:benzoyl-CoA reductase subunit C
VAEPLKASSLDALLERADALLNDLDLDSVKSWKAKTGGKAVGFLPIYVPREVVHAAGAMPVGLMGGGDRVEVIRGDAYFQSYICQIPRSTIELALGGKLDLLDGFLFPSICDVIRNLSGMFQLLMPGKYVRYVDVPQNFDPAVGGVYWAKELEHLRHDMQTLTGRPIRDDDLRASIHAYNENRALLRALYGLRRDEPWRVPTWECYLVLRAGNVLSVEDHSQMIRDYLAAVRAVDRPMLDQSRVLVTGAFCEQPPLGLIKTLERAGCYIVGDDFVLGSRFIEGDVDETGDPIQALARAFLERSVSTASMYEPDHKGEALLAAVREAHAEGVIFAAPSFCDPALLDQPMLEAACDKAGIPYTAFKYSENLGQFQVIREQAGTFADSIKLWSDQ